MTDKILPGGGVVITSTGGIQHARYLALAGALHLETLGMKRRGRSVYALIKEEFNLKGSKQRVLLQFCEMHNIMEYYNRLTRRADAQEP